MSCELLEAYTKKVALNEKNLKFKLSKSDVFSLGLVFLKLFTFESLDGLNDRNSNGQLQQIVNDVVKDANLKNLIGSMLKVNPDERPSFRKVLLQIPGKTTKPN